MNNKFYFQASWQVWRDKVHVQKLPINLQIILLISNKNCLKETPSLFLFGRRSSFPSHPPPADQERDTYTWERWCE